MSGWFSRLRRRGPNNGQAETKQPQAAGEFLATEHTMTPEALAETLGTVIDSQDYSVSSGLPAGLAAERMATEGKNILSPPKKTPEIVKFLKQLANPLMILPVMAGILSFVAYGLDTSQAENLYCGIILLVVVLFNAIVSYLEERYSSNVMKHFVNMLPHRCKVLRDGIEVDIAAEELVRGDIVKFGIGDKIPADLRVIWSQNAKVECSSITGESAPVSLVPEKTSERPTETRNLVFNGSLCLNGAGLGIAIRTGDNTLIGQIARMAGSQPEQQSTLEREVMHLVKFIASISATLAIIFFSIGMGRGEGFLATFTNGFLVVIVANVPQGLPPTVTSVVSIAARKMAKKNVYVKRLHCVETLGSTSCICTDKTGTLTMNVMTVMSFWFDGTLTQVHSSDAVQSFDLIELVENKSFKELINCACLCNKARYNTDLSRSGSISMQSLSEKSSHMASQHSTEEIALQPFRNVDNDGQSTASWEKPISRIVVGDASDSAIFRFFTHLGIAEKTRSSHRKIFEIPFNSTNKYSLTIMEPLLPMQEQNQEDHSAQNHILYMKGAPEIIFALCSHYMFKGEILPLNEEATENVKSALKRSGKAGERVLAFAFKHIDQPQHIYSEDARNFPMENLVLLGLVSLIDPPRPNVPNCIKILKKASIKVIMVTGDHPITAESIARQVNIIQEGHTIHEVAAKRGVKPELVELTDPEVQAVVVAGGDLQNFTDEQWNTVLGKKEIVFARTTPTQKLEIVERNQKLGHVVAVTGDGVNDSPALKQADVGIAMGIMGSDVAREAADVILITDDFAAIQDGVRVGRLIYDNLKKSIAYTLAHLIPEIASALCSLAFSLPLSLTLILVLIIDLGTDLTPAISIAYEKPEMGIMKRPPRNIKTDRLVSYSLLSYSYLQAGIAMCLTCFIAFFLVFINHGVPASFLPFTFNVYWQPNSPNFTINEHIFTADEQISILYEARSAYWLTLITCQFWHIWFIRTCRISAFSRPPTNIVMILGALLEICLVSIFVYIPGVQQGLQTNSVEGYLWSINLIFLVVLGSYTELTKYLGKKNRTGFVSKYLLW